MANIIIETKDITLYRNDSKIFEGISLDIEKTKLLNIFGRNGSGKTSLLKILTGVTEPTSGIVLNRSDDESLYEKIIYVGHKSGLKNNLTVNENSTFTSTEESTFYITDDVRFSFLRWENAYEEFISWESQPSWTAFNHSDTGRILFEYKRECVFSSASYAAVSC